MKALPTSPDSPDSLPATNIDRKTATRLAVRARLFGTARMLLGPLYGLLRTAYRRWKAPRALGLEYDYDQQRFAAHSSAINAVVGEAEPVLEREALSSLITMDYHRIEKGMALPNPSPGFGRDVVQRLIVMTADYEARFGPGLATRSARTALSEYARITSVAQLPPGLTEFLQTAPDQEQEAGTIAMSRDAVLEHSAVDFAGFARNRYSVRHFTGEPVAEEIVRDAVLTAMKSPSVCNRQSSRVHVVLSPEMMRRALSFQNGNRGFGDRAGAVVIVTADIRTFASFGERNQCWIDGGLFAMSLNYALHARGLGVCMLNWSMVSESDRAMRAAIGIPEHEAVIMMMAVGHLPEQFRVACSPRRDIDEVIRQVL